MPTASFKYSNNSLHERGEGGTPPSSPLRFGAFALGQQEDMWLDAHPNSSVANFTYLQDVRRNRGDFRRENKIGGKDERYKTGNA